VERAPHHRGEVRREIDIDPLLAGERRSRALDIAIEACAAQQRGVIDRVQLRGIGLSRHEIDERVRARRLYPLHRGVYAVGHSAVSREAELFAAVLSGGPGAALSHRSAAELWGLRLATGKEIDVTVGGDRRNHSGVRMHRATLDSSEITTRKGISVTTPDRTIIDLARCVTASELERAIRQALYEHLTTVASLASCLSTHEGRRGTKRLRDTLGLATNGKGITRSKLERRFLALLRRHGLPMPDMNVSVRLSTRWIEADCLWSEQRLIVELDSRSAHANDFSFDSDRARDRELLVAGYESVRVTWRQVVEDEDPLAHDLAALLVAG
jgi:very-short-patch-repair endonuclease